MRLDLCPSELMTRDVNCPGEWILQSALRRAEAGELFSRGCRPRETEVSDRPWLIKAGRTLVPSGDQSSVEPAMDHHCVPADQLERIGAFLGFHYPFEAATTMPSKQTATQRKGREKDAEAAEDAQEPTVIHRRWRKAAFGGAAADAVDAGNATHAVMQYIRYGFCDGPEGVRGEVEHLVNRRLITQEQADMVNIPAIADFFATELGLKLRSNPNVLREFKFSILDDGENFAPDLRGEKILLQGVVDCAILEEDGITVVDFKTDKVTEATLPERTAHYTPQVLAYADALSRIYQKPIKATVLYFFHLGKTVSVTK